MIDERNPDPRVMPARRGVTPTQIALIVAGLFIAAFAIWTFASTRRSNPDVLTDANSSAATKAADPEKRCGAQATYDLIKRELFRRAAAVRGADQSAFGKLADYSIVRIDRPLLDSEDDQTSAISCSGSLTLDLPPNIAVVGGRRTLTADVGYSLQRSADGNGEVLTLTRADSIITPLATIARVGSSSGPTPAPPALQPPLPTSPATVPMPAPMAPPPAPRAAPPPPPPSPAPTASARPSFNCANARTRGEIAVCGDSGLAALDRQMAAQYVDALRDADPGTRAALQRSRDRFLGYRDQCPSSACIAQTYRGRMREIRDIADGRLR
ncbi:MAG: hypothetical protein ABIR87_06755 [Sphingomicrobium sp.]